MIKISHLFYASYNKVIPPKNINKLNNEMRNLEYNGALGSIYKIWFSNLLLQIITLLIYRPWAKTKMRKYLYGSISIFGDRLEYSGTGGELFKGTAKAFLWLFLFSLAFSAIIALIFGKPISLLEQILSYLVIAGLIYYSQFSALRYRLNRSRWRSIKASLAGKASDYMKFRLKRMVFNIFTLGLLVGRTDVAAKKYLIDNISIGSVKWNMDADERALDKINFITWILALPTLFLSRFWYKAALKNYTWNSIKVENIRFNATYSGGKIMGLTFSNLFILILTLGFGTPIILDRSLQFLTNNLEIIGSDADLSLLQSSQNSGATGDGMDDLVNDDSDMNLDWGLF